MSRMSRSILAAIAIGAFSLLSAGSAFAADFSISFDDALIDSGYGSLTPGVNHHNDVPVEPDDVVTLDGTIDNGEVSIPATGVMIKGETRTIKPFESYYTVNWRATTDFTGTFDRATGILDLEGSLEQTVRQGSNQCVTSPLPLSISTEHRTTLNAGKRFTEGLDGPGALIGK